jgi:hypothetical protein
VCPEYFSPHHSCSFSPLQAHAQMPQRPGWKHRMDDSKILTYTKDPETRWAFGHPMYLIMNIAWGGPDEPAPDDSKLPQFLTLDYVRVYQEAQK